MSPSGSSLTGGGPTEDSREATACSGTGSMIATLFLRSSFSSLMLFLMSATAPVVSSDMLKLSRRFAAVLLDGEALFDTRKIACVGHCVLDGNEGSAHFGGRAAGVVDCGGASWRTAAGLRRGSRALLEHGA